jgi:hypothetical protein
LRKSPSASRKLKDEKLTGQREEGRESQVEYMLSIVCAAGGTMAGK